MSDAVVVKENEAKRAKQGRSPAYPGIDLESAVSKARALYDAEGKYAAPMSSAFSAWGFSPKSSGAREVRAALKYFGLITLEGDGETGKVKLTEDALRILLDEREDQTEKKSLLRRLALLPSIHKSLMDQFPDGIKSDATVEHYLIFDHGFNKSAAGELVSEFKSTSEFTELFKPVNNVVKSNMDLPKPEAKVNIGDMVQAEVNGALVFDSPKRVRAIQDHEGQKWVFVDDSETGVPMEQVMIEKKFQGGGKPLGAAPILPLEVNHDAPPPTGARKEVTSLDEGAATLIWPDELSQESVSDLEHWLTGILRKAKRRAGITPKDETQ